MPGPEGDPRIKVPAFHTHPLGAGPLTARSLEVGFRSSRLEGFLAGKWPYLPLEACKSEHRGRGQAQAGAWKVKIWFSGNRDPSNF